jgi:hypothetical protein
MRGDGDGIRRRDEHRQPSSLEREPHAQEGCNSCATSGPRSGLQPPELSGRGVVLEEGDLHQRVAEPRAFPVEAAQRRGVALEQLRRRRIAAPPNRFERQDAALVRAVRGLVFQAQVNELGSVIGRATTWPIRLLGLTQDSQVDESLLAIELVGRIVVAARSRVDDGLLASRIRPLRVEHSLRAVSRTSPSPQALSVLEEFPHIRLSSYKLAA